MLALALVTAVGAALRGMWSPCGLSMLSSLNPVAERARGHRFWVTGCWYVAGALAGGAALGAGAALAAAAVGRVGLGSSSQWALVLAAALVAVGSDTAVLGRSLPEHPRQVDERWLTTYRRWIYASGYGVQIGAGFATYIMTAAVYLTVALAVLTGSAASAFVICLVFGGVRGLTIVLSAFARTPERLRATHRRLAALAGPSLWAAIGVEALVAMAAGHAVGGASAALAAGAVAVAAVSARPALRHVRRDEAPVTASAVTGATSAHAPPVTW